MLSDLCEQNVISDAIENVEHIKFINYAPSREYLVFLSAPEFK